MKLTEYHGTFDDGIKWRLVPEGVEIEGSGVERTSGRPVTVTGIWNTYKDAINKSAKFYGVPCEIIIATICTESSGKADAIRLEPGYVSDQKTPHKISVGLTQTLISTAQEAMQMSFGRDWLLDASNAIEAGTAYIKKQSRVTNLDPPMVACAYNAGRIAYQPGEKNRWKMRQYPIGTSAHCDRFVKFFNDAVFMLKQNGERPAVSLGMLIGESLPAAPLDPGPRKSEQPVTIEFGPNANKVVVSPYAMQVLTEVMQRAGVKSAVVTSTIRTPKDEARIFYYNLEKYGVEAQRALFAKPGQKVIDEYVKYKSEGKGPDEIKAGLEKKIIEIGPTLVSKHCADPKKLNVFDIAPSSINNKVAFEEAIKSESRISKYFFPKQDPAYHVEIPIK